MTYEVIYCFDKLFSVEVEADDAREAEQLADKQISSIIRDKVFRMPDEDIQEYTSVSDLNVVD